MFDVYVQYQVLKTKPTYVPLVGKEPRRTGPSLFQSLTSIFLNVSFQLALLYFIYKR
jgi:hypothetical protein